MCSKSILSSYESPMNRGRRHLLSKTYSYESDYIYRSVTSNYEEKYRFYLNYYVNADSRKVRDHIPSSLRESLRRPITSRSSTYPIHAEAEYIRRPGVRYVKPTKARGLGSMAYYADDEYEACAKGSRIGRGEHWDRRSRDREGGRKFRINIDPSWDAPFGIYVDELEEIEDPHLLKVAKNKIAGGKAYIRH